VNLPAHRGNIGLVEQQNWFKEKPRREAGLSGKCIRIVKTASGQFHLSSHNERLSIKNSVN
jgi:hypothetical protein